MCAVSFSAHFDTEQSACFDAGLRQKLFGDVTLYTPLRALQQCLALDELSVSRVVAFLCGVQRDCSDRNIELPEENSVDVADTSVTVESARDSDVMA